MEFFHWNLDDFMVLNVCANLTLSNSCLKYCPNRIDDLSGNAIYIY